MKDFIDEIPAKTAALDVFYSDKFANDFCNLSIL